MFLQARINSLKHCASLDMELDCDLDASGDVGKDLPVQLQRVRKCPEMSDRQIEIMLAMYEENRLLFDSASRTCGSNAKREKKWQEIVEAVNAISPDYQRSVMQIKAKMKNIKMTAKEKTAQMMRSQKKTGGGPPSKIHLTMHEEKVASFYQNSEGWCGIDGYVECRVKKDNCVKVPASSSLHSKSLFCDDAENIPPKASNLICSNSNFLQDTLSCSYEKQDNCKLTKNVTIEKDRKLIKNANDNSVTVDEIRQLQKEALVTQIQANKAIVETCNVVRAYFAEKSTPINAGMCFEAQSRLIEAAHVANNLNVSNYDLMYHAAYDAGIMQ